MIRRQLSSRLLTIVLTLLCGTQARQASTLIAADFIVDVGFGGADGKPRFRALHGVNNGPLTTGETVDLTQFYRDLRIPHIRLHDCEWPSGDVVDIHAVFPLSKADPAEASSYRFAKTDAYLQAAINSGAQVIYRLGESIETTQIKHYVHPPKDNQRWAETCVRIIRHYNEGWAQGTKHQIKYWEIWNEPENRPAMWSGSDAEYFRLYATTAFRIKAEFPELKVGGPSVGAVGEIVDGKFRPSEFTMAFLTYCKEQRLPLDFFSWHTYTNDSTLYAIKAIAIRRLLDEFGFQSTELHLNEWNYLPDNDWQPIIGTAQQGERRSQFYQRQGGAEGAAFVASVLLSLQDSPVDVGNFYAGDTNQFGLFDRFGVPKKTFYAFKAIAELSSTQVRLSVSSPSNSGSAIGAGINGDKSRVNVVIANCKSDDDDLRIQFNNLPWPGATHYDVRLINHEATLDTIEQGELLDGQLVLPKGMAGPSVILIHIQPSVDH